MHHLQCPVYRIWHSSHLFELKLYHCSVGVSLQSVWWPMEATTSYEFHATTNEELSFPAGVVIRVDNDYFFLLLCVVLTSILLSVGF